MFYMRALKFLFALKPVVTSHAGAGINLSHQNLWFVTANMLSEFILPRYHTLLNNIFANLTREHRRDKALMAFFHFASVKLPRLFSSVMITGSIDKKY